MFCDMIHIYETGDKLVYNFADCEQELVDYVLIGLRATYPNVEFYTRVTK